MLVPLEIEGFNHDQRRPEARVLLSSRPTADTTAVVNGYRGVSGSTVIHVTVWARAATIFSVGWFLIPQRQNVESRTPAKTVASLSQ
jgi:hypothetical protein